MASGPEGGGGAGGGTFFPLFAEGTGVRVFFPDPQARGPNRRKSPEKVKIKYIFMQMNLTYDQ
jgi:hypothetical protein